VASLSRRGGPILKGLRPDLIVSPLFGPGPLHLGDALRSTPPHAYALDFPEALPAEETRRRHAQYQALTGVTRAVTTSEYSRGRLLHHLPLDPGRWPWSRRGSIPRLHR
jgi:hypothetical protein